MSGHKQTDKSKQPAQPAPPPPPPPTIAPAPAKLPPPRIDRLLIGTEHKSNDPTVVRREESTPEKK